MGTTVGERSPLLAERGDGAENAVGGAVLARCGGDRR